MISNQPTFEETLPQARRDIESHCLSHIGHKRLKNDDSFYANDEEGLYMVADGMGGYHNGDKASLSLVTALADSMREEDDVRKAVSRGIETGVTRMLPYVSKKRPKLGTTLSFLHLREERGELFEYLLNIGDSRVYAFNLAPGGLQMERLTVDDNDAAFMLNQNLCTPEDALYSLDRNVLTRWIGVENDVAFPCGRNAFVAEVDVSKRAVPDERIAYLLCSDGMTSVVSERDILEIVSMTPSNLIFTSMRLLSAALEPRTDSEMVKGYASYMNHGAEEAQLLLAGHDNVTLVYVLLNRL